MNRRIELLEIPAKTYELCGQLILLFAQVEWLIANVILLSQIPKKDYDIANTMDITQKYYISLLELNFSKKLNILSTFGFDTKELDLISKYRNTISHGLIFKNGDKFTIKKMTKPEFDEEELDIKLIDTIEKLKIEGGKLLDFVNFKGYEYVSPDTDDNK